MDDADIAIATSAKIQPLLKGLGPDIQGAVLADLLSIWLAGFPEEMREDVLTLHIEQMRPLIEVSAKMMRGEA